MIGRLSYPIDRVLFETTEFCENQCYFCYGDYGPSGEHMPAERFSLYLRNLVGSGLLQPESMLILFGGEFLNHPECLRMCHLAQEIKKPAMHLVIITSGKFRGEFGDQVEELVERQDLLHHWEVSIKDSGSFEFGTRLLRKGHAVLFRYDYLDSADLKNSMERFFQHVRRSGIWKEFQRANLGLEKNLRHSRKDAPADSVIIEEFLYPDDSGNYGTAGLTFSPLDRSVMRRGGTRAEATCSLFHPQYQSAIHVSREGTIFPCHLPRFKKLAQPLGNAEDLDLLGAYHSRLKEFKEDLSVWQRRAYSKPGVCRDGCRGRICVPSLRNPEKGGGKWAQT